MAVFVDFAPAPTVIHGYDDFLRAFGPVPLPSEALDAFSRGFAPTTYEGTLHVVDVDASAFEALLGQPSASLSWGLSVKGSNAIRTPCPRPWRHPLRWLRWNPFLTDGLLVTNVQLDNVKLTAEGGEEIVWEVDD